VEQLIMENSAILELARSMRNAVARRTQVSQDVLDKYDEALQGRIDAAADFLRTIHRADEAYDRAVAEAQYVFRRSFNPTGTDEPRR
jgi:hypothetical protein